MKITKRQLRKIIKEEVRAISYPNVRREYSTLLPVVQDLLSRVPAATVADALELLANEVRDGVHS